MFELFFIIFIVCCIRGFNLSSVIIGSLIKLVLAWIIRAILDD